MKRLQLCVLLGIALFTALSIRAQSTSPWMKVGDSNLGLPTAATPNAGYLTVFVRAATMYQNSNFWTSFVETHRQAVITVNLSATIAGVPVSQTTVGAPIELHRNNSLVDLGFASTVVDHLPNTFTQMNMTIDVNKTAQDGLQPLITQVSQLATSSPPVLAVSPEALALTSFSKSVADFLFKANLLVKRASSRNAFPGGGVIAPGIWVCFAQDAIPEYEQYTTDPANLHWNGAALTYKGQQIQKVGYFVIEVSYQTNYYADPQDALSSTISPWVQLYLLAEDDVPRITSAADAATMSSDINSHLADAKSLLEKDPTLIKKEKDAIVKSEYEKVQAAYHDRLVALGLISAGAAITPPPGVAPGPVMAGTPGAGAPPVVAPPVVPTVLHVQSLQLEAMHEQTLDNVHNEVHALPTSHILPQ